MWESELNKNRKVKIGGERYDYLFRQPNNQRKQVLSGMNPSNTVPYLQKMVVETAQQTVALSKQLEQASVSETCRAIWQFIFDNILYKTEPEEELTEPNYLWSVRKTRGGDCDDFALFAATILYNLSIPFVFRITKYKWNPKNFQHIYVVAQYQGKSYIIDPVLNQFNKEIPFLAKEDYPMNTYRLSGLGDTTPQKTTAAEDAKEVLMTLKTLAISSPERLLRDFGYDAESFIPKANKVLAVWENEALRNQYLDELESGEQAENNLNGFGTLGALFKKKPKPNQRVKINIKKIFQTIKKTVKAVKDKIVKAIGHGDYNLKQVAIHTAAKLPGAAMRAGLHLFLKSNVFHVAECFRWGTLSEDQARSQGVPMDRYPKAVEGFKKLKTFHYLAGGEDHILVQCLEKHAGKYVQVSNNNASTHITVNPTNTNIQQGDGAKGGGRGKAVLKDIVVSGKQNIKQGRVSGLGDGGATLAAISTSLPLILSVIKIGKEAGILGKQNVVYAKRPKGMKGFGDPDPNPNEIDAAAMAAETTGSESHEEKQSILKTIWEQIKAFFAGHKTTNYAEGEEVIYTDDDSKVTPSAQREENESGNNEPNGDNGGSYNPNQPDPTLEPPKDNTLLYVGGAALLLGGLYYLSSTQKNVTATPTPPISGARGTKKAKTGTSKTRKTAEENKQYFQKNKQKKGFELA